MIDWIFEGEQIPIFLIIKGRDLVAGSKEKDGSGIWHKTSFLVIQAVSSLKDKHKW